MKLSPESQCERNVRAWLAAQGVPPLRLMLAESDRCWFDRTPEADVAVRGLALNGVIAQANAKHHGRSVLIGYRENVSRGAAQIVIHPTVIEIDFDYWQPWDVIGIIAHGWEILRNHIGRKKTDPFKVAALLKERGIHDSVSV